MTEETKNVALVVEGFSPVTKKEVETIIKKLNELVQKFAVGKSKQSF